MLEGAMDRLTSSIKNILPKGKVLKKESLELVTAPDCLSSLRDIVETPNPRLAEVPFLGIVEGGIISKIYKPPETFSQNSGLSTENQKLYSSVVDKQQLAELFTRADSDGNLTKSLIIGHLHPSGITVIKGKKYVVQPNDSLLVPSMGYPKPIEGGDLAFFKSFIEGNPQLNVQYVALIANTQDGPTLKIYPIRELLKPRQYHVGNIPSQTIRLGVTNEEEKILIIETSDLTPQVEGFRSTPWLENKISELEQQLKPGQVNEFLIPSDIDYRFFVAQLGKPSREYEFGGIYNPKTKSMKITKGYAAGESGTFSSAQTSFVKPRLNVDGKTTDDIFFHTHPWREKNVISFLNIPENSCRPSDSDIDNVMAIRLVEEEDGFERTVVSMIGSRGYISVTEASGIHLDEAVLKESGVSEIQLQQIKRHLALEQPVWTKNYAKDAQAGQELVRIVKDFYVEKGTDRNSLQSEKLKKLKEKVVPYVRGEVLDRFIDGLARELLPKYPQNDFLRNTGFTEKQTELIQKMSGVKITRYKVEDEIGLKEVA